MKRLLVALVCLLALVGCSRSDTLGTAGTQNYVPGDGSVAEFAPDQRGEPISFTARTGSGSTFEMTSTRGTVTVLNVWYAACGPCRAEAKELGQIANANKGKASFVGVNVRDDANTVLAFQRTFAVPYPSVLDPQGDVILALRGKAPPSAVPTTLVLDKQGRVAARILGGIDGSILRAMIGKVVAE